MDSFRSVLQSWPDLAALARDMGVKYPTATAWLQRNNIPAPFWLPLVRSAERFGIAGVTLERLALLAEQKRHEGAGIAA